MDSPTDAQVLELAGRTYRFAGMQEQAIRDELGMSAVAFWLRANRIIDAPAPDVAREFGPTILRLRRLRASRQRQRHAS